MGINRFGEESHTPFRSKRLYSVNGQWFFDTREDKQFGPYRDKSEAEKRLAIFIAQNLHDLKEGRPGIQSPDHGTQDGIEHMLEELSQFFLFRNMKGQTATLVWANRRLKELTENPNNISKTRDRIEVIQYAMDYL